MNINGAELTITETFAVLILNDKKYNGRIKPGKRRIYLIMSIYIHLFLTDKISLNDKQRVIITDNKLTGVKYIDIVLQTICSGKARKIKEWIEYFNAHAKLCKNIYNIIADTIAEKNIKNISDVIVQKIKADLLEGGNIDENNTCLIALLDGCKMLNTYFTEYECKSIREHLENIHLGTAHDKVKIINKSIKEIELFSIASLIADLIAGLG